jgi:hypothetical protein
MNEEPKVNEGILLMNWPEKPIKTKAEEIRHE